MSDRRTSFLEHSQLNVHLEILRNISFPRTIKNVGFWERIGGKALRPYNEDNESNINREYFDRQWAV